MLDGFHSLEGFHSEEAAQETRHTLSLVAPFLEGGTDLLDVGTGSAYVPWLAERLLGVKAWGVDIADFRRVPLANFAPFDGVHLPFPDGRFDVVLLAFVLHHVPNPRKAALLAEAARVSRRLVLVVEDTPRNCLDRWISRRHGEAFRQRIGSRAPFGFFSKSQWEAVFETLGLRLLNSRRLSRFCRAWDAPFARSFFALGKDAATGTARAA